MFRSTMSKILSLVLLLSLGGVVAGVTYRYYQTHSSSWLYDKGLKALERGDVRGAERQTTLLEQKGDTARVHLLRGRIWLSAALAAVKRAKAPPPYAQAQETGQMVLAGATLDRYSVVVRPAAWLSACLVQNPRAASVPGRKELRRALAEFAQIRDEGALGLDATLVAAKCLMQLEQKRSAAEGLNAVLARYPDHLEAHRLLAAIYIDLNSPGNAITHLRAWARQDPNSGLPYRWIGFFEKDSSATGTSAIEAYREALKRELSPRLRARVVEELAAVLMGQDGRFQEALEVLDQCPDEFKNTPVVLTLRTECLTSLGKDREAAELLDQIVRHHPDTPHVLWLRAKAYVDEKRSRDALPLLEKAVRLDPHDYQSQVSLAGVYEQLGDKVKARQHRRVAEETHKVKEQLGDLYRQAVGQPWNDSIRCQMAVLCLQINRTRDARTWLQAALASNPNNAWAHQLLVHIGHAP
ncbi:MAG TPA: tetratricopeptide repeat protein [Gemmataceae bacterium]|jgi:predicted Zn-dependent protease|nr:tetratricopeptide repeat protein [Gemmataceae bacterium]